MEILKFHSFINENFSDTPEEYIKISLKKIQKKIEKFFEESTEEKDISFSQLGLELQSSEFSKFSSNYDNVVIKFTDDDSLYSLFITIPIENGVPSGDNFSPDKITDCFIKFKKYSKDEFELGGQVSKNIKIKDISEQFLIELKLELDEEFGEEEELKIES